MTDTESKIQALLKGNQEIAKTYNNPLRMDQMRPMSFQTGGAAAILTCLDPRCVPENFLGHDIGLPVIRNAGGRATEDAIRSLVILRYLIGASAVLVIHHTDCGKTHITADEIHDGAKEKTPDALAEVDAIQYRLGPASNFEKMIREDVDILRSTKALAGLDIRGFALDTVTGVMTQLEG